MLIIKPRKNEGIEMLLKRYKKKFEKVKILRQLRNNEYYEKPSVSKRKQKQKAIYKEKLKKDEM